MTRTTPANTRHLRDALRFAQRRLAPSSERVSGMTLALYRVASGVNAYEVAQRLDVTKQRISTMEREGCAMEAAGRYRAAVDQAAAEGAVS